MLSMHPTCQIDGDDIPEPSKLLDVDPEAPIVYMASVDVHLRERSFSRHYWQ